MPVLVEAISVIVRRDAITRAGPVGHDRFLALIPNRTFCEDEHLARVGFMDRRDVESFIHRLAALGLIFLGPDDRARDVAVADQVRCLTTPCDWLEVYGMVHFESGADIQCARLVGDTSYAVALPAGWEWERSLSYREAHGLESAIRGARRALALQPELVTARGDLIVALVTLAAARNQDPKPIMAEAAREFRQWFRQTPAGTPDFTLALWAGLSALGYLGCVMERRSLLDRLWVRWALSEGLGEFARAVEPGDLTVIRWVLAELYGPDSSRARPALR